MAPAELVMQELECPTAYQFPPGIATPEVLGDGLLPAPEDTAAQREKLKVTFLEPGQVPNARPSTVHLGAIPDPRLRVVRPIPLHVSLEEGSVIVCWSETDEFGTGDSLSAALDDFGRGLRELYHSLFALEVKLGADLLRIKGILEQHIQPRQ